MDKSKPLAIIHARDEASFERAQKIIRAAYVLGKPKRATPLRHRTHCQMSRAFLFILDSFGIGGAPDAKKFGDEGANTFVHIAERMKLNIPNLASLGLGLAAEASTGKNPLASVEIKGQWGFATEISRGKDTITGHWEIAGVPVPFDWGYFPNIIPAFPKSLTDELIRQARLPGILGKQACLRHRDHRRTRRGTHGDRQTDCLYKR